MKIDLLFINADTAFKVMQLGQAPEADPHGVAEKMKDIGKSVQRVFFFYAREGNSTELANEFNEKVNALQAYFGNQDDVFTLVPFYKNMNNVFEKLLIAKQCKPENAAYVTGTTNENDPRPQQAGIRTIPACEF